MPSTTDTSDRRLSPRAGYLPDASRSSAIVPSYHLLLSLAGVIALALSLLLNPGGGQSVGIGEMSALAAAPVAIPAGPAISPSRTQASPGTRIRVEGYHFGATTLVTVALAGMALSTVTTTINGYFTTPITIPAQLPAQTYVLSATSAAGLSAQ